MSATCRFCEAPLEQVFVDLGKSPLSNAFLDEARIGNNEPCYPLRAFVCGECFLVQLEEFESPDEIFSEYFYFSSYSESWLAHAREFAQHAIKRFRLNEKSLVVEVASNDGYLLQYFKKEDVPVLGIEPARNVARAAMDNDIETITEFFGVDLATILREKRGACDLLVANNVLAHVPDLNDFVAGLKILVADNGIVSVEFPHLLELIAQNQFDTIYHEHFSYFSLLTVTRIFSHHGLEIFDVETLGTHGGSLRVFAQHAGGASEIRDSVGQILEMERAAGLDDLRTYEGFMERVQAVKTELVKFLRDVRNAGKRVVGYGAPAKGNTLLNFCGIDSDLLEYTVDRNPYKQGKYLPGSRIRIYSPERIFETRPDYILILPWNIKEEIVAQMKHVTEWGGKFVLPIPRLQVLP